MKTLTKTLSILLIGGSISACSHSMPANLTQNTDEQTMRLARYVAPAFPDKAARNCEAGSVLLQYDVSEDGKVRDRSIEVLADAGSSALADAAIEALALWRYEPAYTTPAEHRRGIQTAFNFEIEGCNPES